MARLADLVQTSFPASTIWLRRDTTDPKDRTLIELLLATADLSDQLIGVARTMPMLADATRQQIEDEAVRRFNVARADIEEAVHNWDQSLRLHAGVEADVIPDNDAERVQLMQERAQYAQELVDRAIQFGVDGLINLGNRQMDAITGIAKSIGNAVISEEDQERIRAYEAAARAVLPYSIGIVKEQLDNTRKEWGKEIGFGAVIALAILAGLAWRYTR